MTKLHHAEEGDVDRHARSAREDSSATPLQRRYLALVEDIERNFPVAQWRAGDVDIWPVARMDLFLDMFRTSGGDTSRPAPPFIWRAITGLATPLTNVWKSRRDLAHWRPWPRPAFAVVLGDGVSLDRITGSWQDRFAEPLIAAMEKRGQRTFLMQSTNLSRLPWRRPTFAANVVSAWGALAGALSRALSPHLPDHEAVLRYLEARGINAPSLSGDRLARRARFVAHTASVFQKILRVAKPKVAFIVTYYAGLGHAFALACRRQGILCVDLQHCPQDGAHKAYTWSALPENGYSTLPSLFWTWKQEDAGHIRSWAAALPLPWHQSLHGGHTQLAPFLDDEDETTRIWHTAYHAVGDGAEYECDVLVALQPIGGHRATWNALAAQIEAAPRRWRWWLRRHPSTTPVQDAEYGRLLQLRQPNIVIEEAALFPLPALLPHMRAMVSLASGAAGEAAEFGVPALFLSPEARGPFSGLIDSGRATIINVSTVVVEVGRLPATAQRPAPAPVPDIGETLLRIEQIAEDYAQLCAMSRSKLTRSSHRDPDVRPSARC
ncbi:hypothetical protein IAG41_22185 [Sphingomonas sp. JC676]|uniref:hypothetical protein n=1 Tax=Sphingomonas sp. JC676 TaxID=2768065 RepID=UPI001657F9EC|nr:hypothetical protein [Sphingomonas sp. JC676]MBC9035107.1 hypothetical protein [Sphingomonas sp. JC676]